MPIILGLEHDTTSVEIAAQISPEADDTPREFIPTVEEVMPVEKIKRKELVEAGKRINSIGK